MDVIQPIEVPFSVIEACLTVWWIVSSADERLIKKFLSYGFTSLSNQFSVVLQMPYGFGPQKTKKITAVTAVTYCVTL